MSHLQATSPVSASDTVIPSSSSIYWVSDLDLLFFGFYLFLISQPFPQASQTVGKIGLQKMGRIESPMELRGYDT